MKRRYNLVGARVEYGYAMLKPDTTAQEMADRNRWFINTLYIEPDKRGRKYGRALLERVCRDADKEGAELRLVADPFSTCPLNQEALRNFYRRHGFKSNKRNINQMTRKPGQG